MRKKTKKIHKKIPFSSVCSHACEEFGFNNTAEKIHDYPTSLARCAKTMKNNFFLKKIFLQNLPSATYIATLTTRPKFLGKRPKFDAKYMKEMQLS